MTEMFGEAWPPMSVPDLAPDDDDEILNPLSIPQQTILLLLHMVINHETTIFDFSRFLFATLTFLVVKSRHGSNGPVYPLKRRGFFACYQVQRTHTWRKRV